MGISAGANAPWPCPCCHGCYVLYIHNQPVSTAGMDRKLLQTCLLETHQLCLSLEIQAIKIYIDKQVYNLMVLHLFIMILSSG